MRHITVSCAVLLSWTILHAQWGAAQSYPDRPVKIVAGTAAGGQSDRLARLVAEGLERIWGEHVVVEAHPGADGTIGADAVAHAAADGYTLLLAGQSNLALVAAEGRAIRYDPIADFAPIGRIARVPLVLARLRSALAELRRASSDRSAFQSVPTSLSSAMMASSSGRTSPARSSYGGPPR